MLAEDDSGGEGLAISRIMMLVLPLKWDHLVQVEDLVVAVLTSGDNPVLKVLSGGRT